MGISLSKEETLAKINLSKGAVISLKKSEGIENQIAKVAVVIDISSSMSDDINNGNVQSVLEQLLPLGLTFDDNGEIDVFLFSSEAYNPGVISLSNVYNYMKDEVIRKYRMGSTDYAKAINLVMDVMKPSDKIITSKIVTEEIQERDTSLKARIISLFTRKDKFITKTIERSINVSEKSTDYPTYVIFLTDGAPDSTDNANREIRKSFNKNIFWKFVGIGNGSFSYLKELSRENNIDFFHAKDINQLSEDSVYKHLFNKFTAWLK